MTQNPVFCARCQTTRPPLFSVHTYTCVMCGKSRTVEEFKREIAKLRAGSPSIAYAHPSRNPLAGGSPPPAPTTSAETAKAAPTAKAPSPAPASKPVPAAKAPEAPAAKAPPAAPTAKAPAPKKAAPAAKAPAPKKAAPAAKAPAPKKAAATKTVVVGTEPCGWKDCANVARPKSKYCSRACSNKNARWRHAQRKS